MMSDKSVCTNMKDAQTMNILQKTDLGFQLVLNFHK
jgi:hypothetical protein